MRTARILASACSLFILTLALSGCDNVNPLVDPPGGGGNMSIAPAGLEALGPGAVYEGWIIVGGAPVSTGVFTVGPGGAPDRTSFDVDPGPLQMSLAVEGETGEVLDRDREDLDIPDFTGLDLVLSTPAFVRARNNLEWEQIVSDWDAVPTASREFRRTERILLRFEAYAPGPTAPEVKAWLLNRLGDRMYPLVVQPAEDGHPSQVDIQPTVLAPGEYVVELTVTTSSDELVELVAFRLRS